MGQLLNTKRNTNMKLPILTVMAWLVVATLCAPQSRPQRPRPVRPDQLAGSQSTGGKKRPPPPPGSGNKPTVGGVGITSVNEEGITVIIPSKSDSRWIWDDNCKDDRPPFDIGRWVQVRYDECPIAFDDPHFEYHQNFCGDTRFSPAHNYGDWYGSKLEAMWTYPEYKYCPQVPVCLACPALARCGPFKCGPFNCEVT